MKSFFHHNPNTESRATVTKIFKSAAIKLLAAIALIALSMPFASLPANAGHPTSASDPQKTEGVMDAPTAFEKARKGELVLLDIRSPQEWEETGTGTYAERVSMHQEGFLRKLNVLIDNDKSRQIALICAVGGRSNFIQGELVKRGYTNVIDVAEGMLGSRYGPGWIKRGLPIVK